MPEPSPFGRRVLEARKHRNLTQDQLATKSGIPPAVISHFETGVRSNASADNLVKLADALRVTVDYLLGRTEELNPTPGELDRKAAQLPEDKVEILDTLMTTLLRSSKKDPEGKRK